MLPGRMSSCAGALCFGCTTETESTAICAVTAVNDFSSFIRDRIPATNTPTTNSTSNAVSNQRRRECVRLSFSGGGDGAVAGCSRTSVCVISLTNVLVILVGLKRLTLSRSTLQHAEESRYKQ